jgi:hypothetical protein
MLTPSGSTLTERTGIALSENSFCKLNGFMPQALPTNFLKAFRQLFDPTVAFML